MEHAIAHRNQNSTGPHAVGGASLIVGGIVRIDGQRRLGKHQGGLFPLCKKIFRFIAKLCQASYESIAKTTSRNPTAGALPESVRPEPVEACPEGTRRGPTTLTRAPRAQANTPATLPPWNTHARPSTSTPPPPPRRGVPRSRGPHRRPRAVRPLTAGGCFSRAQNLEQRFCSWDESASYGHPLKQPPAAPPPRRPLRRRAART